ncbi:hypothetical protein Aperf_G00000090701 [Anoplocephala perfoliata]
MSGMREHAIDTRCVLDIDPDKYSEPLDLEIYGPRGLRRFLRSAISLSWSQMHLNYVVHELHPRPDQIANCFPYWTKSDLDPERDRRLYFEREGRDIYPDKHGFFRNIFETEKGVSDGRDDFVVHAFMLDHPVPCVGYLLLEPSPLPHLQVDKAIALGVKPGPLMGKLKAGQSVTIERDGQQVTIHPSQVLGAQTRGRRVAILGDSRDSSELRRLLQRLWLESNRGKNKGNSKTDGSRAWKLDCLVHEATGHSAEQGDQSMMEKGHSTARSAAAFAATVGTRQLVLNHFSQRFLEDDVFAAKVRDPEQYSKASTLLDDVKSCKEFKGEVHLSADLKIIPVIGTVEGGDDIRLEIGHVTTRNYYQVRKMQLSQWKLISPGKNSQRQKLCAHIHGVLPYLFIEDNIVTSLKDPHVLLDHLRSLANRIEIVLSTRAPGSSEVEHLVYDLQPLSARSLYGFRDRDSTFIKISLIDPADVPILGDLFLSGAIYGYPVQPFEVHIPFLLQFCADYNLQGMNYLEAKAFRVRGNLKFITSFSKKDIRTRSALPLEQSNPLAFIMTQNGSFGPPSSSHRLTSTDVEVDISACDITNRLESYEDDENLNAGLSFLWAEERARREALKKSGAIDEGSARMPTIDDLLPLTECVLSQPESSQRFEGTQSQSGGLSQRALDELCRLAEASEDLDACLQSSLPSSISAFISASQTMSKSTLDWIPTLNQSQVEQDLDASLLANARTSISTLLDPVNADEAIGEVILNDPDERQDDDLFASILENSVAPEPGDNEDVNSENDDLFPSLMDSILVNTTESGSTSTETPSDITKSFHLPQVDGVDDPPENRVRSRPRRRRLGLRLTASHLDTPDVSQTSLATGAISALGTPPRSQIDSSFSAGPRKFSSPFQNRRGDMTFVIDEDEFEEIDSSVIRFPPEATQNVGDEVDRELDTIEPLPCDLGEPDFALHSSVFMKLLDPPSPPSYSQVQEELKQLKAEKSRLIKISQEEPEEKREIDISLSMSFQEQLLQKSLNEMHSSLLSPKSSSSISRRAFLPIQENHCTLASLELLFHTRRQTGNSTTVHRSSHAISISSLGGFFAPDPQMDPITAAALAFAGSTFLLVVTGSSKELPSGTRTKLSPAVIYCKDEVDLLNWIVYLIQNFDPDILIGYDVERRSWNYAVQRAAKIGRVEFQRDISRLAPERLQCPVCAECLSVCSRLRSGDHFVTSQLSTASCSCPGCVVVAGEYRSRRSAASAAWPCEPGRGRSDAPFACPGRLVFSLWHLLKHELSLHEYSFETVALHVLKKRIPRFTEGQLSDWMDDAHIPTRWQSLNYIVTCSEINLALLKKLDLVARTSEFARVFGIEFFHVLSRGSQYRVESLLLRTARRLNFVLPSPNPAQRARQRAPQAIPLTLEPLSGLHADAPVVVLDFQSLYPSIAIAYNYCFSTAVGRLSCLKPEESFEFGCLSHIVSAETLRNLENKVSVSPNGVVFVRPEVYRGVLPRLWRGLLSSRLMVKDSLKIYAQTSESLRQLLDARQLGLKLIANVMYGYTAASFSGRMPCVEVGDSIVHKGRECLERAIQLVESDSSSQASWAGSKVIYGDTDSLFVKLPSWVDKATAFKMGQDIADAVTASNPAPIKLKLEKAYYPCILEAKKRYIGYCYESPDQNEPKFDAKGIETVRRDHAPFVGEMMESVIRQIFEAFKWNGDNSDAMPRLKQLIRGNVRSLARDLSSGLVPLSSCLLARPYRGFDAYRPGVCAPALQVVRRLKSVDPNREPNLGERITYYLVPPPTPSVPLIGCVKASEEARHYDVQPALHLGFYLDHQLLPPLRRIGELLDWHVDSWLSDIPRCVVRYKEIGLDGSMQWERTSNGRGRRKRRWIGPQGASNMMHKFFSTKRCCLICGVDNGIMPPGEVCCTSCLEMDPAASTKALIRSGIQLKTLEGHLQHSMELCSACVERNWRSQHRRSCGVPSRPMACQACVNLGCPNLQSRQRILAQYRRLESALKGLSVIETSSQTHFDVFP